jgi:hypothetical protein
MAHQGRIQVAVRVDEQARPAPARPMSQGRAGIRGSANRNSLAEAMKERWITVLPEPKIMKRSKAATAPLGNAGRNGRAHTAEGGIADLGRCHTNAARRDCGVSGCRIVPIQGEHDLGACCVGERW